MTEIVKVQIPFESNDPAQFGLALVYAKDRRRMVQQKIDQTTKVLMGDDVKAFFEAEYRASLGRWTIGRRVKDRDW